MSQLAHIARVCSGVAKWAIELGPYHITYEPRTAIKSQALVDFVNNWTDFTSRGRPQGLAARFGSHAATLRLENIVVPDCPILGAGGIW